MSAVEQIQIPEKLFYRINEVATATQIKPYVLRYWESEFPMLNPEKDENEQRRYRRADIDLVLEIKRLLYTEKFTIAGARKQLRHNRETQAPKSAMPSSVSEDLTADSQHSHPVRQVNREKARRLNSSIGDLRRDVDELFRILN
jgi:DNA-binding transcriptional MerR regulator